MNNDDNPSSSDDHLKNHGSEMDQPTLPPKSKQPSTVDETLPPTFNTTVTPASPKALKEFGDYELVEEIARGGMGVVYRGRQKSLNRDVAIKMILAGQFASQDEVDRFYTEAKSAANLDHPNVVPVYEFGEIEGHHFFSMKLIEGSDLSKKMKDLRNDLTNGVRILQKVCAAVHHAHQRGVLHRDLKPGNILLDADNQPYITDLGLARTVGGDSNLTRTGAVIGTPSYMPPEQASGTADITTAADIYSLGAILYELLTGRPPFLASSPVETLMKVINEMPERPSTLGIADRDLETICMKCLAKEPSDRYESAAMLAADLESWIRGEPISVRAPSLANATRFWLKQNFGSAIWALVIGPVIGTISAQSLWYSTIGFDTRTMLSSYDLLPSAEVPHSFSVSQLPAWAQIPLMVLFAFSIVFIGYVTARFVNPKHRGADLAAGTVVGMSSSLAAFMIALGPVCVLSLVQYDDMRLAHSIVAEEPGATPKMALDAYPELEEMQRGDQISALVNKMESDHFYIVPRGIWMGALLSLAVYFFPCLFETAVAGPILRKDKRWFVSLPAYMEVTFPVVTVMTIVALAVGTWVIFGASGFRITIRLITLLSIIAVAIAACRLRWNLFLRIGVQLMLAGAFVWFFATDFKSIPGVSGCKVLVADAHQKIEQDPRSFEARKGLIESKIVFANMLADGKRHRESVAIVSEAISNVELLSQMAKRGELDEFDDDLLEKLNVQCRLRKVHLLITLGKLDEAESLWKFTRNNYPGHLELAGAKARLIRARTAAQ